MREKLVTNMTVLLSSDAHVHPPFTHTQNNHKLIIIIIPLMNSLTSPLCYLALGPAKIQTIKAFDN